jgi:hypothetical protein
MTSSSAVLPVPWNGNVVAKLVVDPFPVNAFVMVVDVTVI